MARILAIEPDPAFRVRLQRLVRANVNASVTVVASTDRAVALLTESVPDLILTSSLLSGRDEERLSLFLRYSPDLDHVPVLTVPPLVQGSEHGDEPQRGFWSRVRRLIGRKQRPWTAYDFSAIAERIEEALSRSRSDAQDCSAERPARLLLLRDQRPLLVEAASPVLAIPESTSLVLLEDQIRAYAGTTERRQRAPRWNRNELPWLDSVKLSWGADLRLVNISSSGLLVESGIRFTIGNRTEFQLASQDRDLVVTARVVRSNIANVDSLGAKYVTAAAFERPLDILAPAHVSEGPSSRHGLRIAARRVS